MLASCLTLGILAPSQGIQLIIITGSGPEPFRKSERNGIKKGEEDRKIDATERGGLGEGVLQH